MHFNFSAINNNSKHVAHKSITNFADNPTRILKASSTTPNLCNWTDTGSINSAQKRYLMSSNNRMKELKMVRMNLKFVTVNMFSTTLKRIDLSHNKIIRLPDEITDISELEHLKVDYNLIVALPERFWQL